jgi:cytochrome c551/c552
MSAPFDAWWLPAGLADAELRHLRVGDLECRYPEPTPALIDAAVESLRAAGRELAERPVEQIVGAIDRAARRLADPGDPLREEAERRIGQATGYHQAMTRLVLDRMSADWSAAPILELLRAELGDPSAVDGFIAAGTERRHRAYGPMLAFHVFAGNVPGVAVTSLVRSLLVKGPSLGKLASGQPVLPVLFARAVHEVDPALARAIAVTYWPGGAAGAEERVLRAADTVIVYGGSRAVRSIRERTPDDTRVVVHGPRLSVALIGEEALASLGATADTAARAVATFDQHGCVSPHAFWVESAGGTAGAGTAATAAAFAEALAGALERVEGELPRGRISAAEASTIQQERGAAEIRGHAGGGVRVFAGAGTRWTVVYDPDPAFRPSCLNRFVHVHPVPDLDDVVALLAPLGDSLQSVAVEAGPRRRTRLAHRLARVGAARVTTLARLPWPPPQWHHDGRGPLEELVRWVDLED